MPDSYSFRPLTPADRPLFENWLAQPHIGGWWGDAASEWAEIQRDWKAGHSDTDMRIVAHAGRPFAYVQDYEVHFYDMPHYAHLPDGARAMDCFLGDPAYLRHGHGAGFLRARARQLIAAGAPLVAVDPSPDNAPAIAAYLRAGFSGTALATGETGAPVRLMTMAGA